MNETAARSGYSAMQIALHWTIVALVAFQLVFGEDMADMYRALQRGREPDSDAMLSGTLHIWVGFAVLAVVALRLALRLRHGAPPVEHDNSLLAFAASATHIVFYVLLFGMPITGALAYYFDMEAMGEVHEIGKPVLIILISLHVLGALYHQFVRRDGTLRRMLVPR